MDRNKTQINVYRILQSKSQLFHYLKIASLYLLGYLLASHYRPFHDRVGFFDFGLADSGVGFVSILVVYLIFTPPRRSQSQAKKNSAFVLFAYLSQEIYCYFFPGFVGTFDFKDLIYYFLGFIVIHWGDVLKRNVI